MPVGYHVSRGDFADALKDARLPVAQVFLRSPRQGFAEPKMSPEDFETLRDYARSNVLYVHAPYTLTVFKDLDKARQNGKALSIDIRTAVEIGNVRGIVVHEMKPQKTVSAAKVAAATIAAAYDIAGVSKGMRGVPPILIENKTSGREPAEFAALVSGVRRYLKADPETAFLAAKIGICYDTQHAFVRSKIPLTPSMVLEEIAEIERGAGDIALIHLNDSMVAHGSKADRHEDPGKGHMFTDFGALRAMVSDLWEKDVVIERPVIDRDLLARLS